MRMVIAMCFGMGIGLERERTNASTGIKGMAGLRTHTLVCLGSCIIQLVSVQGYAVRVRVIRPLPIRFHRLTDACLLVHVPR